MEQWKRGLLGAILVAATLVGPAAADELSDFMEHEKTLYSQGQQEELIRHFFRDRREGFFVDIGCYMYKKDSTTYYLEKHLGWSGIAVDAQEIYANGWKRFRPNSRFFAYAVTDKSGETITFLQADAVSATEIDTKNLEHWQSKFGFEPKEITVPTITMNDLLDREGVETFDFLSMDINGMEPIALAAFDIERFRPELVHVEASPHRHEELKKYFAEHGYERIDAYLKYDAINWYFTPKN
jgi:FkbM family methyltransferase